MILKVAKETWEKFDIKTVKYYNEKENTIELWQKMSGVEIQLRHSNIRHIALERIKKCCGKKTKRHYRKRKRKI